MRRFGLIVLLLSSLTACAPREGARGAGLARFTPEFYRGYWVFINYWASWCKPCMEEIPALNELARSEQKVVVLGVNFDGATGVSLKAQVEALGIKFPTLAEDPSAVLGVARPEVLPTTLVIDPEGNLARTLKGAQTLATLLNAIGGPADLAAGVQGQARP